MFTINTKIYACDFCKSYSKSVNEALDHYKEVHNNVIYKELIINDQSFVVVYAKSETDLGNFVNFYYHKLLEESVCDFKFCGESWYLLWINSNIYDSYQTICAVRLEDYLQTIQQLQKEIDL